jgi:hypothetical protein
MTSISRPSSTGRSTRRSRSGSRSSKQQDPVLKIDRRIAPYRNQGRDPDGIGTRITRLDVPDSRVARMHDQDARTIGRFDPSAEEAEVLIEVAAPGDAIAASGPEGLAMRASRLRPMNCPRRARLMTSPKLLRCRRTDARQR